MGTEFITKEGKLMVQRGVIYQKRLLEPPKNYWFHSFVLILLLMMLWADEAVNGKPLKWFYLPIGLMWIFPHLETIYRFLFVNTWRTNIPLSRVKEVMVHHPENELEEKVTLVLRSGRRKTYVFRKSEQQAGPFAEMVSSHMAMAALN
jgi:hypothetical protein